MKRNSRSCCFLTSFSSSFSTCGQETLVCRGLCFRLGSVVLTDGFLLPPLPSAYFCRNGTRADGGSVAGSGWRHTACCQPLHTSTDELVDFSYRRVVDKNQHHEVDGVLKQQEKVLTSQ